MRTDHTKMYLSKLFHTVFEADHVPDQLKPSVFFLADKTGNLISRWSAGEVSDCQKEMLSPFSITGANLRPEGFNILTLELALPLGGRLWNGVIGVCYDTVNIEAKHLKAYLQGLVPAFKVSVRFKEDERKARSQHETTGGRSKMTALLKETGYTERLDIFAEAFMAYVKETVPSQEETAVFIKESFNTIFAAGALSSFHMKKNAVFSEIERRHLYSMMQSVGKNRYMLLNKHDLRQKFNRKLKCYDDYYGIPVCDNESCIGLIIVCSRDGGCNREAQAELLNTTEDVAGWFSKLLHFKKISEEKKRKDLLLKVTRKFYSSKDVGDILKEIMQSLQEAYPGFQIQLRLSNEWDVAETLPVQLIDINDSADSSAAKAYVTGEVQTSRCEVTHKKTLYVPLNGRQGVYGVCEMETDTFRYFPDAELDFIQILADTGGNAIENAELYQQSRKYIEDLQLINETANKLNANLKVDEAVDLMLNKMIEAFQADAAGLIMFEGKEENRLNTWRYHSAGVVTHPPQVSGLLNRMRKKSDKIFAGDWSSEEADRSFKSVIGVPMFHKEKVIGAVLVLKQETYGFSFDMFKLCQSLVHHSTLAFVNAILHEEMKELVVTDYLTKLFTREYMDDKVAESIKYDSYGSLILFDIDHFKIINDKKGHQTGDEVLVQVSEIIKNNIKKDKDIAVRWGGEEVAVYLPKTTVEEAEEVAERIRLKVMAETSPAVTVSCGVASWAYPEENPSVEILFNNADEAMYNAKQTGRNKVTVFGSKKSVNLQ